MKKLLTFGTKKTKIHVYMTRKDRKPEGYCTACGKKVVCKNKHTGKPYTRCFGCRIPYNELMRLKRQSLQDSLDQPSN